MAGNEEQRRGRNGLLWEFMKRYNKLNRIRNDNKLNQVVALNEIMTFSECEIVYMLPRNTVIQDYLNGKISSSHVRKSASTMLITVKESRRLYEDYWTQRARKNEKYLYCSYDNKKMTETEFFIKYGIKYDEVTDKFRP